MTNIMTQESRDLAERLASIRTAFNAADIHARQGIMRYLTEPTYVMPDYEGDVKAQAGRLLYILCEEFSGFTTGPKSGMHPCDRLDHSRAAVLAFMALNGFNIEGLS